jgi:hypothetical protein
MVQQELHTAVCEYAHRDEACSAKTFQVPCDENISFAMRARCADIDKISSCSDVKIRRDCRVRQEEREKETQCYLCVLVCVCVCVCVSTSLTTERWS